MAQHEKREQARAEKWETEIANWEAKVRSRSELHVNVIKSLKEGAERL